ncbi:AraC family transcriptional regulator [Novosphingobium guangzhouense]|uniref:HTH araC/xylS-type domain-containing protein n=1 Tax=Novosphingobium guangzhouense TaxID=1850347 RepID=A0A2K2FZA0_9SPHN|nr:AraC family transcriptional regulator [Novosphingobium guangzhouense]PNU04110.1 hypothetical protein A8V01_05820 [Novosphingobium guangzhouense]
MLATGKMGHAAMTLSELLGELRLSGRTWCYGDLAERAGFAVAGGDAVFVHAVIHGSVRLACASGAMAQLGPGEVALVLSGEAHALRTGIDAVAATHDVLRRDEDTDLPLTRRFGEGRVAARVLSARLQASWPDGVGRAGLPAVLRGAETVLRADAWAQAGMGAGATALLTRLAEALMIAALRADPACRGILSGEARDAVAEAMQLIAANPAHPWTVASLARAVGMGRSNFAALFSGVAGKAPMEVVAEHRMEHAASLLRLGRMKVAEIAELAGYGSEAAFSRRFSRHFGTTPSRMREAARQAREAAAPSPAFRAMLADARQTGGRVGPGPSAAQSPAAGAAPIGSIARGRVLATRTRSG